MLTVWIYGCCWCWKMQSSVLSAADTQSLPFHFHLQLPSKNLFHFLTVCLAPLVKKSLHLWYSAILFCLPGMLPVCSQLFHATWCWAALSWESFSVPPALQLSFGLPLWYVYSVALMGQRYITTLAVVLDWWLQEPLGDPRLSHFRLILSGWWH